MSLSSEKRDDGSLGRSVLLGGGLDYSREGRRTKERRAGLVGGGKRGDHQERDFGEVG